MKLGYAFVWVEDAEKAVQFYEEAFGFERRSLTDNGELGLYAEMETGATTLAIADQKEARVLFPDGFQENNAAQAPSGCIPDLLCNTRRRGVVRSYLASRSNKDGRAADPTAGPSHCPSARP